MRKSHLLKLVLPLASAGFLLFLVIVIFFLCKRRERNELSDDEESKEQKHVEEEEEEEDDLFVFSGGEDLTICDILDAPGEVIGKSSYGTLYKAFLQRSNKVRLLRFLRPVCTVEGEEFGDGIQLLGSIRHPNLVPLLGFYAGPRGEKLLIHPFYKHGDLAQFIRDGSDESHKWSFIYRISLSIAKGLFHLHTGLQKPVIHGNLKSKNILLDHNSDPHISDFSLHLLLNPTEGQEMLESSAAEGYKAPELIKMRDASAKTDIYSLGIIFLELFSGKEAITEKTNPDEDVSLLNFAQNAVLDRRIEDLYHPDLLRNQKNAVSEHVILKFFHLSMACCSDSPSLRPEIKQVIQMLEDIEI